MQRYYNGYEVFCFLSDGIIFDAIYTEDASDASVAFNF